MTPWKCLCTYKNMQRHLPANVFLYKPPRSCAISFNTYAVDLNNVVADVPILKTHEAMMELPVARPRSSPAVSNEPFAQQS